MDPTLLLIACVCVIMSVGLAVVCAAGVAIAAIWHEIHRPPPEIRVDGGPVDDERRNEARASSPALYVDPTDYLLPPTPAWHQAPVADDLVVYGSDGAAIDLTGSIDQLPTDTNMDEPTVLPDGTVVLRGEIIHQPEGRTR